MKIRISVLLLTAYLLSVTEIHELLKVNVVFSHFFETRKQESISFLDFLMEHYVTDDHNSNDNERDEQLPFKSHDLGGSFLTFVFMPQKTSSLNFNTHPATTNSFSISDESLPASSQLDTIWNPPKLS